MSDEDEQQHEREDAHEDEADAAGVDAFETGDVLEAGPEDAVDANLRAALDQMRDESERITSLSTGDEQVQAAEQFADAAGKLDERIGAHARAEDERGR